MAIFTFTGITRFADAETRAALSVGAVHTRVFPAEETVIVYTEPDSLAQMVPISNRFISVETFRDRFTSAELKAIASSTDADIKYVLLKLSTKEASSLLDLDKDEVVNTMAKLVSLGLITPARSAVITA
jgi:hypothetical protein